MISGDDIVREAREWIGTPFVHLGRVKGSGVDCIGLIAGIVEALSIRIRCRDRRDYSRNPDGELQRTLDACLPRVPIQDRCAGHVVLFGYCRDPQHVGVVTADETCIHASNQSGVVEEVPMDPAMVRSIRGVYALEWKD